jgi:general secretion pathway protein G
MIVAANYLMKNTHSGVTLLELMVAMTIVGILSIIAIPSYQQYIENSEQTIAIGDIRDIEATIERYYIINQSYPADLNAIGFSKLDPWDNPYQFLNFDSVKGKGKFRKDKNLVPINSDYDLYSKGPDGRSVSPLTAKHSRDDVIRAKNGQYIGIAEDY